MTSLAQYDAARAALAAATRIDEILPLRAQMEHLKLHAKHVQDKVLLAEAADIQIRAEAKLGFLLIEAEKVGYIRQGRPRKPDPENPTISEGFTLKEIGVSHRLSADSQQKASISEQALEAMIAGVRQRIMNGRGKIIEEVDATDQKKRARENREKILGGMQLALPDKKFGVILADPEWRFATYSRDSGLDRAADNHYPTSETDAICARPVGDIAAPDCVLFLWATAPMLPDALKVMGAWGFEYKSHTIWKKDRIGTGYWFRNQHELLLVGTRGKIPAPAMGTQSASVIDAPVAKHSQKPDCFYELIEGYFPTLPKIELNARRPRDGWESWGNEAPAAELPPHDPDTGEVIEDPVTVSEVLDYSAAAVAKGDRSVGDAICGTFILPESLAYPADPSGVDVAAAIPCAPDPDPPAPLPELSEFDQLKAFSDFCFPRRSEILRSIGPAYAARGMAYSLQAGADWGLTEAGYKRFYQLDSERRAAAAAAAAAVGDDAPEIVDGVLQCRLPLDGDEIEQQAALTAIAAGEFIDSDMLRHLVGLGFAGCTTTRAYVTDEGRAWLSQFIDAPRAPPLDLPLFLAAGDAR